MSKVDRLLEHYARHIAIPWRTGTSPAQRVIFCTYPKEDELRLRAKLPEFELRTLEAQHGFKTFDLTDTFAIWLSTQRYAQRYFERPELIETLLPRYREFIRDEFRRFVSDSRPAESDVVAIVGTAMLFGLLKVKDVVDDLAPATPGRLLVFFPGSYENQNYKLLDAYDGWNYLAVPITPDTDFGWSGT